MYGYEELERVDAELLSALNAETARQRDNIELIAAENFVSKAVMAAMGSPLTNKYAEGYPGARYYGGCEKVDVIEKIAIERAKKIFGAEHINVQPHAGALANFAVYFALLKPGDTIMGMNLSHGGHLTHGSPVNISGKYFNIVPYGVSPDTELVDYEEVRRIALENKPKLIVAGASSYPRMLDFEKFSEIAKEAGAYLMVDMAHIAGNVAVGRHPSPVPYADVVTTTTHKTLKGPRGGMILCKEQYAKLIDKAVFPGIQGGPLVHMIAAKAVGFKEVLEPSFKGYIDQMLRNATALSDGLIKRGFKMVSNGTDNHLMLVDLRGMNITGKHAENLLDAVNITCNKNTIPFDPEKPGTTSGIRLGTPAVTARGMNEQDMEEIAEIIDMVIKDFDANKVEATARVKALTGKYPLY